MPAPTRTIQISHSVMQRIRAGVWKSEDLLPTERELADQWKVSRNTVRAALRNLEERGILHAVQGSGRRVRSGHLLNAARIGLLTRQGIVNTGQAARYAQGITEQIEALGHHTITFAINVSKRQVVDADSWRQADFNLLDGAIVIAFQYEDQIVAKLANHIPTVVVARDSSAVGVPSFFVDLGFHAADAVRRLAALGHRRIAVIVPGLDRKPTLNTMVRRGFDLGRHWEGLPIDPEAIITEPREEDLAHDLSDLYQQWRSQDFPFTAVIAIYEASLTHLVQASRSAGDDLTQRMAMVCLSDLSNRQDMAASFAHYLTPIEQIGRDAVQCLHDSLHGKQPRTLDHPYYGTLQPCQTFVSCPR
ncbi:MAG: GntR family transcriptional regulator [Phycisphaeraceae bacterium]